MNPKTQRLYKRFVPTPLAAALALALLLPACSSKVGEGSPDAVEVEPGTMIEMAAAARVGMTIAGEITERQRSHYFRFDNPGQKRDMISVRVQNRSSTLNPSLYIFDHEQIKIGEISGDAPGSHVELSVPVDAGKSIYVLVQPNRTLTEGDYELSVTPKKAYDANEDNNYQGSASVLKFDTPVDGAIMDSKDSDWFRVTPAASGKVNVYFDNLSPGLKPSVTVFFGTALPVGKNELAPGADINFDVDVQQGQDFHIWVRPFEASDGKYRLATRPAGQASQ